MTHRKENVSDETKQPAGDDPIPYEFAQNLLMSEFA